MNFKTTIILIVLLAAAGLALFFTRAKDTAAVAPTEETGPASVDAGMKLTDIESKDVNKIVVTGDQAMTLEKTGADWRITAPVNAPADSFEVDALLRDITDAHTHGQIDPAGPSAAAAGLAQPRYHVELTTKDKTLSLAVGAKSAVGDDLYVQIDGRPRADVIPTELSDKLGKGVDALRKTAMVSAGADDIKQLVITRTDGSKLSLAKTGGTWQITAPTPAPADDSAASDLVFALTGLRADSFVEPSALPKTAMARPQLTVAFSTASATTQPTSQPVFTSVRFGSYEDMLKKSVYVSVDGSDAVTKMPASSLDSFRKTELDVRDKKIVDIDPASVTRLTITIAGPKGPPDVVLTRRRETAMAGPVMSATSQSTTSRPSTAPASKWLAGAGSADDAKVQTLLDALHPLRVDKYVEAPAPATQPTARIVLTLGTSTSPGVQTFTLTDPGHDQPVIGTYDGLNFEVARTLVADCQGNWTH